jgi:hypothetical protein
MRRLTAWIAGAAGGLAAYRLLRRRPTPLPASAPDPAAEPDPRAEELRAKLAETHDEEPQPEVSPADVEARRRSVHEAGRAALDEMRGTDSPADD